MNIVCVFNITDKFLFKTSRLELSKALQKRGHNVTIVMAKTIGEHKTSNNDILYIPTVEASFLSSFLFNIILFFYIPYITYKKKADVVIAGGISIWFPFAALLKLFDVPVIMDIRGLTINRDQSKRFDFFLKLSKYLLDGYTTITPELKEIIVKKYKLSPEKIGIWSSGVSLENFTKPVIVDENIKKIKESNLFILIYHGSYSPTRGVEEMIKAMSEIKNSSLTNIKLFIIGISKNKIKELSSLCEQIQVTEMVEFIPPIDYKMIPSYIWVSDVGIIPLPPENKWWQVSSPLKTLEYLAMSKPIIATNIPFHKIIFEKGECGILLNTNDPKSLAEAIIHLYQNKDKLNSMGETGKKIVEKYYTWDKQASYMESFLKNIVSR